MSISFFTSPLPHEFWSGCNATTTDFEEDLASTWWHSSDERGVSGPETKKKDRTPSPASGSCFLASLAAGDGRNPAEACSELRWRTVCIYSIHVFKSVQTAQGMRRCSERRAKRFGSPDSVCSISFLSTSTVNRVWIVWYVLKELLMVCVCCCCLQQYLWVYMHTDCSW